jgi:hypothetical protein
MQSMVLVGQSRGHGAHEMAIAQSVAEVLKSHVTLEVEGIDRMYLNRYVPRLQHDRGVVGFFRHHRGHQFASSARLAPITFEIGLPHVTANELERRAALRPQPREERLRGGLLALAAHPQ